MLIKIAIRNILRNRRRSLATILAITVGMTALLLFASFRLGVFEGLETNAVQKDGHLTVFRRGYFLFGQGNPTEYGIADYQAVMRMFSEDAQLHEFVTVQTPVLSFNGIAGNYQAGNEASKTFLGTGFVPSDREKMRQWNEYGTEKPFVSDTRMADGDISKGLVGAGLARMLALCTVLAVPNCPDRPQVRAQTASTGASLPADIAELARAEDRGTQILPRIDVLAATAGGAPNVVSLDVSGVDAQAVKELDDNYLAMNLQLAQRLVYGRGVSEATGIVLQLHRSEDLPRARARLLKIITQHHLDLEVRDFSELNPFYVQVKQFFTALFLFIALIMGVIVLFSVTNTMTMAVMERTVEIGTLRAIGVQRSGIRRQFLVEGALLGLVGSTIGVAGAFVVTTLVNHSGAHWSPPGNAGSVPLRLAFLGGWRLTIFAWIGLAAVSSFASFMPAYRAAKMQVVEALRHA